MPFPVPRFPEILGRLGLIAALLLSAPALADTGKPDAPSPDGAQAPIAPQIIGGDEVSDTRFQRQFRFMVALETREGLQLCGGTLIAAEWVLTAAHCLPGLTPQGLVVAMNSPTLSAGALRVEVAGIVQHPFYDPLTQTHDLAMLRLAAPVWMPPVRLATEADMAAYATPGIRGTALGWGDTIEGGNPSDRLREVRLPLIPNGRCRNAYPDETISRYQLCAGRRAGGVDTCQGDSGGPLLAFTDQGWAQIGITSWGYGCARAQLYGVYTRVADYTGWIEAILRGDPACIERNFSAVIRRPTGFQCYGLPGNDDSSSAMQPLGFPVRLGDYTYSSVYVNNNGNLTFGAENSAFSPIPLGQVGAAIIAPFFADVDTRAADSRIVLYGQGVVRGRRTFSAIWQRIGYYQQHGDRLNTFQVVITENGLDSGNFTIEFNYDQIQWETGDASQGVGGLGGYSARAGFSLYPGTESLLREIEGAGVPGSYLDGGPNALVTGSNVGVPGRYVWWIQNGAPL